MNSDAFLTYSAAVRLCSTLLVTTDSKVIDRAILEGIGPALYKNLFRASNDIQKEALWGLSNLTASEDNHIKYVLGDEDLV